MYKKQISLFKFGYMINDNENESEIEKHIIQKWYK